MTISNDRSKIRPKTALVSAENLRRGMLVRTRDNSLLLVDKVDLSLLQSHERVLVSFHGGRGKPMGFRSDMDFEVTVGSLSGDFEVVNGRAIPRTKEVSETSAAAIARALFPSLLD